jgi:ABC-2 type transport system permease protein
VLFAGALVSGWRPSVTALAAALLGFAIVAVLVTGLGLLLSALNVYFRDFENIVDLLLVVVVWLSPVLYPWTFVREALGSGWLLELYLANPLTLAVQLFQRAFWAPGVERGADLVPDLFARGAVALLASLVVLVLGQLAFSRLEGRFAQEL